MNRERFHFLRVVHHETDLLIGVPHGKSTGDIEKCALSEVIRLRQVLLDFSAQDPRFLTAMEAIDLPFKAEEEIETMFSCGKRTGTGPMAAVAGLFAQQVGKSIVNSFGEMEVLVENGGDLWLRNASDLVSAIHAGTSSLSDQMAFVLPGGEWGICTSSGTIGHSFSRGRADALTVVAASAPLADAWATAIANRITSAKDMTDELEALASIPEILGCAMIVDEKIGIFGELEVKVLNT